MKLTTRYLGLELAHPFMPGASPLADTMDSVRRLEDAGASEKLIEVLLNPSSTSPSTNPAAAQSQRYAACQAQANRQFPNDNVARTRAFTACVQAK